MKWIWQLNDWPEFKYDDSLLRSSEEQLLGRNGELRGVFKHLSEKEQNHFQIQLYCEEALKTSAIEGEILDRESVQSSLRKQFGLQPTSKRKIPAAENGIARVQVEIFRNFSQPLNDSLLHRLHQALLGHRADLPTIGKYRTDKESMQIVSGPIHHPRIHYEAPPSSRVRAEMKSFIRQYRKNKDTLGPIAHSALAHLHFLAIHPFADGNGRLARALSEKALAEKFGRPTYLALAQVIEENKKAYYSALHETNHTLRIDPWLEYFARTLLAAQEKSLQIVEFLITKKKYFEHFSGQLNSRQSKVIRKLFDSGPDGFTGGLSAANYLSITNCTRPTSTRDLSALARIGALNKTGTLRYARYSLNLDLPGL